MLGESLIESLTARHLHMHALMTSAARMQPSNTLERRRAAELDKTDRYCSRRPQKPARLQVFGPLISRTQPHVRSLPGAFICRRGVVMP